MNKITLQNEISQKPLNAPSTTGRPSGGGRGNNAPRPKK